MHYRRLIATAALIAVGPTMLSSTEAMGATKNYTILTSSFGVTVTATAIQAAGCSPSVTESPINGFDALAIRVGGFRSVHVVVLSGVREVATPSGLGSLGGLWLDANCKLAGSIQPGAPAAASVWDVPVAPGAAWMVIQPSFLYNLSLQITTNA